MPGDNGIHDVLLTQRFLPEHGGSIRWMYESYRRWSGPVDVITHNYYDNPPRTPEFSDRPPRPASGDDVPDINLQVDRRDIFLHDWGLQSWGNIKRYWQMTRAVRERFGDHGRLRVHCTHVVPEVFSLIPLKWQFGRRLTIICYAHGEEISACCSSKQLRFMLRAGYRQVDLLIANSQNTADMAREHIEPSKIHVINPGVDLAEFDAAAEAGSRWRHEQGFDDKLIVLTVGRLDPRKNHMAVINAVAAMTDRFENLLYVTECEGREEERLQARVNELGIAQHVRMIGPLHQKMRPCLYGACDVFAMPAIRDGTDIEGFGIVFLEAAACGKPVVAGCEGGQVEAVDDGHTGLIVDGTDLAAVSRALESLLADASLRQQLGRQGQLKARNHDWAQVVQRTTKLVETVS